ncbi:universal stress protein [Cupriavidus necator]
MPAATAGSARQRLAAWLTTLHADLHVEQGDRDEVFPRVASILQADLLIAGGYGRSRRREFVLSGTTRALLRQSALPVFMSH